MARAYTSEWYIQKITRENACSIETAEKLDKALHRENKLHEWLKLRFRPLYGDFDVVGNIRKAGIDAMVKAPLVRFNTPSITNPAEIYQLCAMANELWCTTFKSIYP